MDSVNLLDRLVIGKAGRDKGKYFIVTEVQDQDYVFICNGTNRTLGHPKRKKNKHLQVTNTSCEELKPYTDATIKAFIKSVDIDREV